MASKSKIDSGGPAFPSRTNDFGEMISGGMTLRDWFAGQAIGAALGMVERAPMEQYKTMAKKRGLKVEKGVMYQLAAIMSYEIADAMIAARKAGA